MEIPYSQLTLYEAERFHQAFVAALEKEGDAPFVLDFHKVEKIDLCCIQLLLAVEKQCQNRNRRFQITGATAPRVRQAFSLLNLHPLLEVAHE